MAQTAAEAAAHVAKNEGKAGFRPPAADPAHVALARQVAAVAAFNAALLPPENAPVSGVTMEQLALASHRCGAHARALRQYEQWLRHRKGQLNNAPRGWTATTFDDSEVCSVVSVLQP